MARSIEIEKRNIAAHQRLDAADYADANGHWYSPTAKGMSQQTAAERSKATRDRLFALIERVAEARRV